MPRTSYKTVKRSGAFVVSPWQHRRGNHAASPSGDAEAEQVTEQLGQIQIESCDTGWDQKEVPLTLVSPDADYAECSGMATLCVSGSEPMPGYALTSAGHRIAITCTQVMSRVECQQEEDWALLLVQLHNYSTGASAALLAEKVCGDAMRLQPPSDPGLLAMIGVTQIAGMPELVFDCRTLKVGEEAQRHAKRFHSTEAALHSDKDLLVNVGELRLGGLPTSFVGV